MRDDTFIDFAGSRFYWDSTKAATVYREHKVWFSEALTAFVDERHLDYPDPKYPVRGQIVGKMTYGIALKKKLVLVVYIEVIENRVYRLITARKPTATEKRHYETSASYHPNVEPGAREGRRVKGAKGAKSGKRNLAKELNREMKRERGHRDPSPFMKPTFLQALQESGLAGRGVPGDKIPTKARTDSPLKAMQERAWRIQRASYLRSVGARVREMRLAMKMTQLEIARQTKMTQADVSKIERNKLDIGVIRAKQFALVFGVSPAAILYTAWPHSNLT